MSSSSPPANLMSTLGDYLRNPFLNYKDIDKQTRILFQYHGWTKNIYIIMY